jgi:hypothetical protein
MSAEKEGVKVVAEAGGDNEPKNPVQKPKRKEILDAMADRVNARTKNIKLKVARRYDYYAIDMYSPDGHVIDTLVAGMNARETENVLSSIERLLVYDSNLLQKIIDAKEGRA